MNSDIKSIREATVDLLNSIDGCSADPAIIDWEKILRSAKKIAMRSRRPMAQKHFDLGNIEAGLEICRDILHREPHDYWAKGKIAQYSEKKSVKL